MQFNKTRLCDNLIPRMIPVKHRASWSLWHIPILRLALLFLHIDHPWWQNLFTVGFYSTEKKRNLTQHPAKPLLFFVCAVIPDIPLGQFYNNYDTYNNKLWILKLLTRQKLSLQYNIHQLCKLMAGYLFVCQLLIVCFNFLRNFRGPMLFHLPLASLFQREAGPSPSLTDISP